MNFNIRQTKVLNATESKILCLASAAAGKTRVLTERIRILIDERNVNPEDIVAITFTNMAADEMKRRIGEEANGTFIGTIHSYGNKVCELNGINTLDLLEKFEFNEVLKKAIQIPVNKYKKIKHLLIDECQDLSPLEYQFLSRIPTENIFFVGDNRQAIYSFKGCTDEYLYNMWKDNAFKKYYLTENYRNAPNIINFAERFLDSQPKLSPSSIPVKTKNGILETHISFSEALDELEWSGNWGSWFILTRTNDELVEAQDICKSRGIPHVSFKKGDMDSITIDLLMSFNRVKILTIHSAKGLENKNVIVTGARVWNEEERRIAYVAATRAEKALYWCSPITKRRRRGSKEGLKKEAESGRIFDKTSQEMIAF